MSSCLFLSDLHLHDSRPEITELFLQFLQSPAVASAEGIYILGDLFELWAGDDAGAYPDVLAALKQVADRGISLYFMPGNRDFLVGPAFARESGCEILPDPTVITLNGQQILLMHGDSLCTDDHEYQQFRAKVRTPEWRDKWLSMPLAERMAYFQSLRDNSKKTNQDKPGEIMDVNHAAVEDAMSAHQCHLLIHGHTHRQAIHHFQLQGTPATRVVLGDWYESGNVLSLDASNTPSFTELYI